MEIILTSWALDAYLELKHKRSFSNREYKETLRKDVLRLKNYPMDSKFKNSKFWSIATLEGGSLIKEGYKMKWHNLGSGRVQLRLPVAMIQKSFLCKAYIKDNPKSEKRELFKFAFHVQLIREGKFLHRGFLT